MLEAIYLLGRGRSFRTRHTERLIRHGADRLMVHGRTDNPSYPNLGLAFDRKEGLEARIDGRPAKSLAELSEAFPVQVMDPGIHRLVEEGPAYRRRWLDWGVFHVEPGFVAAWADYRGRSSKAQCSASRGERPYALGARTGRLGHLLSDAARSHACANCSRSGRRPVAALLG